MLKNRTVVLLLILLIGLVLRLNGLTERSLWTDEFFTIFQATGHGQFQKFLDGFSSNSQPPIFKAGYLQPFLKNDAGKNINDVTAGLLNEDTHPPLYFWIMHYWMRLFKNSIFALRFFSVLMGLLAIFLGYKVTRIIFDEKSAIFAALFLCISSFAVRFSQEARSYALILVIIFWGWIEILNYEKQRKIKHLVIFSLISCFGVFTHYFYLFLLLAQILYFTFAYRNNHTFRQKLYLSSLFPLLSIFFWYMVILSRFNFNLTRWIFGYPATLGERMLQLFSSFTNLFVLASGAKLNVVLKPITLILFSYFIITARKENFWNRKRESGFCIAMLFVPMIILFVLDLVQKGALLRQERFAIFFLAGLTPLTGAVLNAGYLRSRAMAFIFICLIFIISFFASGIQFGPAPKYISEWINTKSGKKPCAVFVYNVRSVVLSQAYYLNDQTYVVPVSNKEQLKMGIESIKGLSDVIFLVRHYHRTDPSAMNASFMEEQIDSGFRLRNRMRKDDIAVTEYVKCE